MYFVRFCARLLVAAGLLGALTLGAQAQRARADALAIHVEGPPRVPEVCGTALDIAHQQRLGPRAVFSDGFPMSGDQEPALLTPNYRGPITLRNLWVTGDIPTIRFNLYGGEGLTSQIETWTRTGTDLVDGRVVSLFTLSWSPPTLSRTLQRTAWGWDDPSLYWGEILPPNVEPGLGFRVHLRVTSDQLPHVPIARLADDVQYSSHVVNIVLRGYGDTRANGDEFNFDLAVVTKKFYEYFEDSYDTIAVIPANQELSSSYDAYHRTVQNDVSGIGKTLFDNSLEYGSAAHRLHAVELFLGSSFGSNAVSSHELGHQWGSYYQWTSLTDIAVRDSVHDPLFAGPETRMGAVLEGTRRVRGNEEHWEIENTPAPIFFHPLTLYGMGLLPKEAVPEIVLFEDQRQLSGTKYPPAGTVVNGPTRSLTVYNLIGRHGERSGPTPSVWERATVVVSRDELLSQREMDYWTFLAQRIEDPNSTGLVSYEGYASFDIATGRGTDLRQAIRPKNAPPISPLPQVDFPPFGISDIRDVRLDAPLATHYSVGQRVRLSGSVSAADDRNDFDWVLFRFWRANGADEDAIRVWAPVSSAHSFSTEFEIQPRHPGRYQLEVFLFWPESGAQYPRSRTTPITIE